MNRQTGSSVSPQTYQGAVVPVLFKGTFLALLLSVALIFIAAMVLYYTALPEKVTPYLVFGISTVAILWGSSYTGKRVGARGWLNGGVVGILYVIIMLVIGLIILDDFTFSWNFGTKLFLGFVFGAIGGMWGVNK